MKGTLAERLKKVRVYVRWGKAAKIIFWTHVAFFTSLSLFGLGLWYYINYWHYDLDLKLVQDFLNYKPPLITQILDRNDEVLIELPGIGDWNKRIPEYRRWVKSDDIPPLMRYAILAAEDQRFFEHEGLDYRGIVRAFLENGMETLRKSSRTGKFSPVFAEGASTLTQQAIELTLLAEFHEREIRGELSKWKKFIEKVNKMRMAVWLEEKLTERLGSKGEAKRNIFEIVANVSYCGHSQYGIASASRFFFGKELPELTPPEAATIAGLFRNPGNYSPYRNGIVITARRNGILKVMAAWNYISRENLSGYYAEPLTPIKHTKQKTEAPAVVEHVLRSLWGTPNKSGLHWENGVTVKTTVSKNTQLLANAALEHGLNFFRERQKNHAEESIYDMDKKFFKSRAKEVQGALVVLQNGTGEILAMVGGASNDYTSFNRAVEAFRQPGSAFKTFVYGAAIEQGKEMFRVDCLSVGNGDCKIPDTPISVKMGRNKPRHHVENYDGRVFGSIPVWVAFARSQNMAAMHLARMVGIEHVLNFASRLGLIRGIDAYPTTAIGAEEVTVLGLTAAYATFPMRGAYAEPHILNKIVDDGGRITDYHSNQYRVIDDFVADKIVELLRHTVLYKSGTARALNENNYPVPIAGKTGTTNMFHDAWFCGFTYGLEGITICAWVGMDDATPLATGRNDKIIQNEEQRCSPLHPKQRDYCEAGGKTALPIVKYFMQEYYKDKTPPQFPEGLDGWIRHVHENDWDPTRPQK